MYNLSLRTCFIFIILLLCIPSMVDATRIISITTCQKVSEPRTIPSNIRDQFTSEAPEIHAVVVLEKVKPGTRVKGTWVAVDATEATDYEIASSEVEAKDRDVTAHFSMTKPGSGWPVGNYKLDLFINDRFITMVTFWIVPESGRQPLAAMQQPPGGRPAQRPPQGTSASLLGCWQCQTQAGPASLVFQYQNRLVFNDEPANYTLAAGSIRVQDDYGLVHYGYTLRDNTLVITTPQCAQLHCMRTAPSATTQPGYDKGKRDGRGYPGSQEAITPAPDLQAEIQALD